MRSANKLGRMVTADVDKALANIGSVKPDMSGGDEELKKAVAPQRAETFTEAFRRNRAEKGAGQTFTWGGKSYSTNMAGEGAKRSAATTTSRPAATSAPAKSTEVKPATPGTNTRAQTEMRRTAARSQAAIREKRAENQADFRRRVQSGNIKPASTSSSTASKDDKGYASAYTKRAAEKTKLETQSGSAGSRARLKALFGFGAEGDRRAAAAAKAMEARRQASSAGYKPLLRTGDEARKANKDTIGGMKKGGNVKKFAKGGSVDGCAVRGKTRAPMKKGK